MLTPQTGLYYIIVSRIIAIIVLLINFSLGYPLERPKYQFLIVVIPVVKLNLSMIAMLGVHSLTVRSGILHVLADVRAQKFSMHDCIQICM